VVWVVLAHDSSVVGFCEHGNEHWGSLRSNFLTCTVTVSLSKKTLYHEIDFTLFYKTM